MAVIRVELAGRGYDVHVGRGLLDEAGTLARDFIRKDRVSAVADSNSHAAHGAQLEAALGATGVSVDWFITQPGEGAKSWSVLEKLVDWLLDRGVPFYGALALGAALTIGLYFLMVLIVPKLGVDLGN